jgi:hypothetical protein
LIISQKVSKLHIFIEIFRFGILVGKVYLVVLLCFNLVGIHTFFNHFLLTIFLFDLIFLLRLFSLDGFEEIFMNPFECICCEQEIVVILVIGLYKRFLLLWEIQLDVLVFVDELASHFGHVHVDSRQVMRNIIVLWLVFFGFPSLFDEIVVFSGKKPRGRVAPDITTIIKNEMVLCPRGEDFIEGFSIEVAILIATDDIGRK